MTASSKAGKLTALGRPQPPPSSVAAKSGTGARSKAAAAPALIDDAKVSRALAGRVLLRTSLDGALLGGGELLRYPGSIDALRSRVAKLYGLWAPSVKISYSKTAASYKKCEMKSQAGPAPL